MMSIMFFLFAIVFALTGFWSGEKLSAQFWLMQGGLIFGVPLSRMLERSIDTALRKTLTTKTNY
jgi:hypothetical protein